MSNIGSIHFISQNQTIPAHEHAKHLAKELNPPSELVQSHENVQIDSLSEGAKTDDSFEKDSQDDTYKRPKQRKKQSNQQNSSSEKEDKEPQTPQQEQTSHSKIQANFFGQSIDLEDETASKALKHLDIRI